VTLLFVAEKRQQWSWVLTDFEASTVARMHLLKMSWQRAS